MEKKINVIIFGASGLIGSGVLDECLDDERVKKSDKKTLENADMLSLLKEKLIQMDSNGGILR